MPDASQTQGVRAILENERLLSSRERYMLSFVRGHASLVEELDDVMHAYEYMEKLCKQEGLSHRTASECRRYVNQNLMTKGDRVRRLADMLIAYFWGRGTQHHLGHHRVDIRMLQSEDVP